MTPVSWRIPITAFMTIMMISCSTDPSGTGSGIKCGPGGVLMGMTRQEVIQVMHDEVQLLQMSGQPLNPYSTRYMNGLRDESLEVMYYYTGMKKPDDRVTGEELVPIILMDDAVVGWGWDVLEEMTGARQGPGS